MKFWNYISEFLLFRWLFGSHSHNEAKYYDVSDTSVGSVDSDFEDDADSYIGLGSSRNTRFDSHDYGCSQSYDDFNDGQDDYDMMDDDF